MEDQNKPQEATPEAAPVAPVTPTPEAAPVAPTQDLEKPELEAPHFAGGWIRFLAYIIDAIILGIVSTLLQAIAGENLGGNLAGIVALAYLVVMIALKQQTVGMMILKLKLVHADKKDMNWWGVALLREILGRIVCALTLGIGYLIMFWTGKKQGLHDMVAKTYVIREK